MPTKEKTWETIYEALSADLPKEAEERSDKNLTKKGYDTTGYGYQYIVNRFNDILGINDWWFEYKEIERVDGQDANGKPRIAITMDCLITVRLGESVNTKACSGGHTSNNYADARKGAITNSFKKTAALFGVGKRAYEGSIDDDNQPVTDGGEYNAAATARTNPMLPKTPVTKGGMFQKVCTSCDKQFNTKYEKVTTCWDCKQAETSLEPMPF